MFSSKAPKGLNLIQSLSTDFYMENFDRCLVQQGFPQASIKIKDTEVKLIGVPIVSEDSEEFYKKQMNELNQLMTSQFTQDSQYIIQLDPTPYLYIRRQLSAQYLQRNNNWKQQDQLLDETPMMPIDYQELQLDPAIFDQVYLIQQKKNGIINDDQYKKQLKNLIENPSSGFFGNYDEKNQDQFYKVAMDTIMYEYDANRQSFRPSLPYLTTALYYCLMQGPTFLCDISKVYMRIYQGQVLPLEELKVIFKELFTQKILNADAPSSLPFQAAQLNWRQFLIDYYLLFIINKASNANTQPTQLNVFVENLHFEPLRLSLLAQEGQIIQEVQSNFHESFKFPQQELNENDEQMIEKHVLLDFIENFPIWKERLIRNPFPYISQDYLQLTPTEQKEIQKTFFKYNSIYSRTVQNVNKLIQQNQKT